jgi:hypothetical protein
MKSIEEVMKTKKDIEHEFLKIPGVNGVAVGYKIVAGKKQDEPVIRVYVNKKRKREDVPNNELIPETIKGVRTDVVKRDQPIVAHSQLPHDTTMYDIMAGGINVGNPAETGTLGAIAVDNNSGELLILSCCHVFAPTKNWSAGDAINNPAENQQHIVASLKNAKITSYIDAAIASIKDPTKIQCEIVGIGPVKGNIDENEINNMLGRHVRKRGVTTGITSGLIETIGGHIQVQYDGGLVNADLSEQIEVAPDSGDKFSDRGDSGACIIDDSGKIVGLLVGGDGRNAYANHIQLVLNELNITICKAPS